jgi:carboxypeptidase PM20D1
MMARKFSLLAAVAASVCLASPGAAQSVTDADKAMAREIIEQMVKFRTAKGYGQVPAMAEALATRFRAAGFAAEDIQMIPAEIDGEKTVGLVVRYKGSGKSGKKPIAILAHMDVVDALKENWSTDPYVPVEKDGYLYGRGSVDNKAGMTLVSTTFIRLKKAGWVPTRDLLIAFSGDEETGMVTTRMLTQHPWVKEAEFALNSDAGGGSIERDGSNPTFSIQSAEKTFATFMVAASNPGGHSSSPRPDNAIFELADAIKAIQAQKFPVQFNEITRGMVKNLAQKQGGELGTALTTLLANPNDAAARVVAEKYPEYTSLLWTTCVPTMLKAGNAANALPQNAVATVNCRIFPGTTVASVKDTLATAIGNPKITITQDGESVESPVSPARPELFASLRKAVDANYPGAPLEPSMSSGGTDGREFRRAGIPTYGAGSLAMVRPDDNRAHGTDERLRLDSFYKDLTYWDVLLKDVAGPKGGRK